MNFFNKNFRKSDFFLQTTDSVSSPIYEIIGICLLIIVWMIIGYIIFSRPGYEQFSGFLPIPSFKAFYNLIQEHNFWYSVYTSLKRVIIGITVACAIGIPCGIIIGFCYILSQLTYPPIQFLRMISPLSVMPIALLVFANFESAIYFLIAMSTLWPIIINVSVGVAQVNQRWINMALNQGAKNHQLIFKIIIPASIPYIVTSLRLALGVAWIVLVPAEFLGVSSGLGYMINDARDTMEYDRLMAIIIAIGMIGYILDRLIQTMWKKIIQNRM